MAKAMRLELPLRLHWRPFRLLTKMTEFILIGFLVFTLLGCTTRHANPRTIVKQSDHQMSCNALSSELTEIEREIIVLLPGSDKEVRNMIFGMGGLVGMAFVDLSDVERTELSADQERYKRLEMIAQAKKCSFLNRNS